MSLGYLSDTTSTGLKHLRPKVGGLGRRGWGARYPNDNPAGMRVHPLGETAEKGHDVDYPRSPATGAPMSMPTMCNERRRAGAANRSGYARLLLLHLPIGLLELLHVLGRELRSVERVCQLADRPFELGRDLVVLVIYR